MKITALLHKGNIRPKDRIRLLLADEVSQQRDGKALLSEADRLVLIDWKPRTISEVEEYRAYSEGRKDAIFGELDAQTVYLRTKVGMLLASKVIGYALLRLKRTGKINKMSSKITNSLIEDRAEALSFVLKHTALSLNDTIHNYALELAGEQLQKELFALNQDAEYDADFLDGIDDELKQMHKKTIKKWFEVKARATKTIKNLIDKGKLSVITKNETEVITGESLYRLKGNYRFAIEFKEQVEILEYLGKVVLILSKQQFAQDYATLLGFMELYKKLSRVFGVDLTYKIRKYIKDLKEYLGLLKEEFNILLMETEDRIMKADYRYLVDLADLFEKWEAQVFNLGVFNLSDIPDTNILKAYYDNFERLFGNFWEGGADGNE